MGPRMVAELKDRKGTRWNVSSADPTPGSSVPRIELMPFTLRTRGPCFPPGTLYWAPGVYDGRCSPSCAAETVAVSWTATGLPYLLGPGYAEEAAGGVWPGAGPAHATPRRDTEQVRRGTRGRVVRGRDDDRDNPANPGAGVSKRGGRGEVRTSGRSSRGRVRLGDGNWSTSRPRWRALASPCCNTGIYLVSYAPASSSAVPHCCIAMGPHPRHGRNKLGSYRSH